MPSEEEATASTVVRSRRSDHIGPARAAAGKGPDSLTVTQTWHRPAGRARPGLRTDSGGPGGIALAGNGSGLSLSPAGPAETRKTNPSLWHLKFRGNTVSDGRT
eukprot:766340-Hanusia_phi.AAC.2